MEDYRNGKISHVEFHQNLTDGLRQKMKKDIYVLAKVKFVVNMYGRQFEFAVVFRTACNNSRWKAANQSKD